VTLLAEILPVKVPVTVTLVITAFDAVMFPGVVKLAAVILATEIFPDVVRLDALILAALMSPVDAVIVVGPTVSPL
jgi:hypothetical protein